MKNNSLSVFIKVSAIFALLILALEMRLRLFSPSQFISQGEKTILPANKEYVYVNKNSKKMDPIVRVKRNSLGFRGAEPPPSLDSMMSLVVMGGSTAACDNLNEGKTWVDLIDKKFSTDGQKIWVNNAGLAGHSTIANVLLLEDYVVHIHPKVIVFFVGINDIDVQQGKKYVDGIKRNKIQFNSLSDFFWSINRNVHVVNMAANLAQQVLKRKRAFSYNEVDFESLPLLEIGEEVKIAILRNYKEKDVKEFSDRLKSLLNISRTNQIVPIFITTPSMYGEFKDHLTGVNVENLKISEDRNAGVMGDVLELYLDEVRKLAIDNVAIIDLARMMPKSSEYFCDFYHFSNKGAEKAAELIYPELRTIFSKTFKNN